MADREAASFIFHRLPQTPSALRARIGELWLADRDCFDPGFRVFSIAHNTEITSAPLDPALAPFNLSFAR